MSQTYSDTGTLATSEIHWADRQITLEALDLLTVVSGLGVEEAEGHECVRVYALACVCECLSVCLSVCTCTCNKDTEQ